MPESHTKRTTTHESPATHDAPATYDVAAAFALPPISGLMPAGGTVDVSADHRRVDYFDTADHALLRAGITLLRETDAPQSQSRWRLTAQRAHPAHDGVRAHDEVRADPTGGGVPIELAALVRGIGRGQPLARIASISTERTVTRLLDAAGETLACVADRTVHSAASGDGARLRAWREISVRTAAGQADLARGIDKKMRGAGARRSTAPSPLARALPDDGPLRGAKDGKDGKPRAGKPSAGDAAGLYIRQQQEAILAGDLALRLGDDGAVHRTRVATRRLRSTLRVFGDLVDSDRAAALDSELRWYAGRLGEVRDRQVLRRRLDAMLDDVDDSLLLGPVRARVDTELRREQAEHWSDLQRELAGDRYLAMLADIDDWVTRPPWTASAAQKAAAITGPLARAERTAARRLARAAETGDPRTMHGARKAAKRARYAAEAAEPAIGAKAAGRATTRYASLQDVLGEHQDSLVSADLLRRLGAKAGTTEGENGFAFGILHEREQQNRRAAREAARRAAKRH
jgi:CHAD domain-containing protein